MTETTPPEQHRLVAAILGNLDAVFAPYRWRSKLGVDHAWAAIVERRQRYLSGRGLAAHVANQAGADRVRLHRDLLALQAAGAIRLHGSRTKHDGISIRRLDDALTLCGLPTLASAWPLLDRLAELHADPAALTQQGFILERHVVGNEVERSSDPDVCRLETSAAPLLASGLVETATDAAGRIGWRLTDAGREALASEPPEPPDVPPGDDDTFEAYRGAWDRATTERDDWTAERASDLAIPLSSGLWLTAAEWRKRESRLSNPKREVVPAGAERNGKPKRKARKQ